MLVLATPMRNCGKALSQIAIQSAVPVRGDLIVVQEKSEAFGRYSNVARFHMAGSSDAQPTPTVTFLRHRTASTAGRASGSSTIVDAMDG